MSVTQNWHRIVSRRIRNGDEDAGDDYYVGDTWVGVVTRWKWPDPFDGVKAADLLAVQKAVDGGVWRESPLATAWVGNAVAEVLGLDLGEKAAKQKIKALLATWIKTGALEVVEVLDEHRKKRPSVQVGRWAEVV